MCILNNFDRISEVFLTSSEIFLLFYIMTYNCYIVIPTYFKIVLNFGVFGIFFGVIGVILLFLKYYSYLHIKKEYAWRTFYLIRAVI